jgi:hypothetical protein
LNESTFKKYSRINTKYRCEYSQLMYEMTCTLNLFGSQSNYADCPIALVFIARIGRGYVCNSVHIEFTCKKINKLILHTFLTLTETNFT